jgi:hypothetical protein
MQPPLPNGSCPLQRDVPDQAGAWRRYCRSLEKLGIDPYAPDVPADDPRHSQVAAIRDAYAIEIGLVIPVPPGWEGPGPLRAIRGLADLGDWLAQQWMSVLGAEIAGEHFRWQAREQAAQAVRNAFRVLDWLGVKDRPDRPPPPGTVTVAKQQIDELERWVRAKVREGWTPPTKAKPAGRRRRTRCSLPDDDELNLQIKRHLREFPSATIRQLAKALDVSSGKISSMAAWHDEMTRRKAAKPPPRSRERPLTEEMLASIGVGDDPSVKVERPEVIWRWLLENAKPEERAAMHRFTPEEREKLLEAAREQFKDE